MIRQSWRAFASAPVRHSERSRGRRLRRGLVLQVAELAEAPATAQELQQHDDDEAAEPEPAAAHGDAPAGERAAQAAAPALVAHLRGVELGVVAKRTTPGRVYGPAAVTQSLPPAPCRRGPA